jgi:hypothetical protein
VGDPPTLRRARQLVFVASETLVEEAGLIAGAAVVGAEATAAGRAIAVDVDVVVAE